VDIIHPKNILLINVVLRCT